MLVIEAKETMQSDQEIKTMVVAGVCDPKDITSANTVQSSQLANLIIRVDHEGQVKDTSTKGPVAEFLGKLFGF
jgi:flagellar basal body L-ring protein FlgH